MKAVTLWFCYLVFHYGGIIILHISYKCNQIINNNLLPSDAPASEWDWYLFLSHTFGKLIFCTCSSSICLTCRWRDDSVAKPDVDLVRFIYQGVETLRCSHHWGVA